MYVLENGVCLAKKKTKVVKKTLDPTYQQALLFDESPQGKVLQVSHNSCSFSPTISIFYLYLAELAGKKYSFFVYSIILSFYLMQKCFILQDFYYGQ